MPSGFMHVCLEVPTDLRGGGGGWVHARAEQRIADRPDVLATEAVRAADEMGSQSLQW